MTAYLIADVDITNHDAFDEYRREVPAAEARYGGDTLGAVEQPQCSKAIGNHIAWSSSNFQT
jgi:uncharacterized protein (DUF1330 family)